MSARTSDHNPRDPRVADGTITSAGETNPREGGALHPTIRERDTLYRVVFEATSDGLLINDMETERVLVANPAACRMHGYDDMTGFHPSAFIHPSSHHLFAQYVSTLRAGGEFHCRAQDVRKDGSVLDVEVFGRALIYQGRPVMLGVVRDVSEEVRAFQTLEARVAERTHEIERRREVAEALRDLLAAVNSQRTLDEVLDYVVAQARRVLGSDSSAIFLPCSVHGEDLLCIQASSDLEARFADVRMPFGMSATGLAFVRRQPVAVPDIAAALPTPSADDELEFEERSSYINVGRLSSRSDTPPSEQHARAERSIRNFAAVYRAMLAVPLAAKEETYGTLALYFRAPREFTDEETGLAMAFADQAALAIENARLRGQAEQRAREIEALYRADEQMYRSLRLDEVLQSLADVAAEVLQADKTLVAIWNDAGDDVRVPAAHGIRPDSLARSISPEDARDIRQATFDGPPVREFDTDDLPRNSLLHRFYTQEEIRSTLAASISVAGQVFGGFTVSYTERRTFTEQERRLVVSLAQRAGLAIENARLYEQAQQAATLEERQRLARELHDAVTQTLFSASLIAEVIPELWEVNPAEARRRLQQLRRLTRGALAEMRSLLVELRPGTLTDLPLADLLRQLAEATAGRSHTEVSVTTSGEPRVKLPPEVQVTLYRIAQEALNNVAKHARAARAEISLRHDPDGWVLIAITDDGQGFDPTAIPAGHLGVGIMRERARAIAARIRVESGVGAGTRVEIHWRGNEEETGA